MPLIGLVFAQSTPRPSRARWATALCLCASAGLGACAGEDSAFVVPTVTVADATSTATGNLPGGGVGSEGLTTEEQAPGPGQTSGTSQGLASSSSSSSSSSASNTSSSIGTTSSSGSSSSGLGSEDTDSSTGSSTGSGSGDSGGTDDTGTEDNSVDKTCLPLCERGTRDAFADCVVEFKPNPVTAHYVEEYEVTDPATGNKVTKTREYYGWNHDKMPGIVLGPPKGVYDTVSLGCEGSLTVGFVDPPITDGPGPDLIAFENPFAPSFPEPFKVEVSDDACTWIEFPCNPITLEGCGGISVVHALPGKNIDPTDPAVAGGDAFDLATIGLARARFVRVTSVSREYWLAKENTEQWCDPGPMTTGKGGSDIDAFAFVHAPATPPE